MSTVAIFAFCLPTECSEKVTLGLTVLLAYTVFQLTTTESMPKTSEFLAYITMYFTIVILTTSLTVALSIVVVGIKETGRLRGTVPPRKLLQTLAFLNLIPIELVKSCDVFSAKKKRKKILSQLFCPGTNPDKKLPYVEKAVIIRQRPAVFEFHIRDNFNLLGTSHSNICRLFPRIDKNIFENDQSLLNFDLGPPSCFQEFDINNLVSPRMNVDKEEKKATIVKTDVKHRPRVHILTQGEEKVRFAKAQAEIDDGSHHKVSYGVRNRKLQREITKAAEEIHCGLDRNLKTKMVEREWVAVYMAADTIFFYFCTLIHLANTLFFIVALPIMVPDESLDSLILQHLISMNASYSEQ